MKNLFKFLFSVETEVIRHMFIDDVIITKYKILGIMFFKIIKTKLPPDHINCRCINENHSQ